MEENTVNICLPVLKCQFDENLDQFCPHFFVQNNQFNRKTFFDVNKIGYNDSSGREKLLQTYEFLVSHLTETSSSWARNLTAVDQLMTSYS